MDSPAPPCSETSFCTDGECLMTEVEAWLSLNNMSEWIESFKNEGYDDLEELRLLVINEPEIFEKLVTKPGHRKKMSRVLMDGGSTPQTPQLQILSQQQHQKEGGGGVSSASSSSSHAIHQGSPALSLHNRSSIGLGNASYHSGTFTDTGSMPRIMGPNFTASYDNLKKSPTMFSDYDLSHKGGLSSSFVGYSNNNSPSRPMMLDRDSLRGPTTSHSIALSVDDSPFKGRFSSFSNTPRLIDEVRAKEEVALLKIIVVGDSGCGKTSYIRQLVEGTFSAFLRSTVGLDFHEKKFFMKGQAISVQFWDISGQERFTSMTRSYYKGAHGAIVCYDLSRPKSFELVDRWKKDIDSKVFFNENEKIPIPSILMGCKRDLEKRVDLNAAQITKYCEDHCFIGWFETSAKTNYNVKEAAEHLVTEIMRIAPKCCADAEVNENIIVLHDEQQNSHFNASGERNCNTVPTSSQAKPTKAMPVKKGCC